MAVLAPGQGGLDPLTFCPAPPLFFHRLLIIAPHSELGGPAPQRVLARTATDPVWYGKTRMVWLPDGKKMSKIYLFVLT